MQYSCQRSISTLIFCGCLYVGRDTHIYAYKCHLVCLQALSLSLCFIATMFMREGNQVKPMIPGPILVIRKFLSYFYVVLLAAVKPKIHKNLGYLLCFILVL
jgi:hypothetical protein